MQSAMHITLLPLVNKAGGRWRRRPLVANRNIRCALCSKYNDAPETASRPYLTMALWSLAAVAWWFWSLCPKARSKNLGRSGWLCCHGVDMVAPSGEGATRCIKPQKPSKTALTPSTISTRMNAGRRHSRTISHRASFWQVPPLSSTKSMTGHSLGADTRQFILF